MVESKHSKLKKKPLPHGNSEPHTFRWSKKKAPVPGNSEWKGKLGEPPADDEVPITYFRKFFSTPLLKHIVEQTNLLSTQNASSFRTTEDEIEQYIGILIRMGMVPMPSYKSYWSDELRFPPVADVMSRNRFTDINKFVLFKDNS